jgi:hypothetical protein
LNTLSQVLKKSGHDIYENIITVMGLSFCWFVILIPAIFFLTLPVALLYLVLTAIPALAGVLYAMRHKLDRQPFGYRLFLKGFVKFYGRSLIFSIVLSFFVFILASAWWYYVHNAGYFSLIIAIFQTYFFIFVNLALLYTLPILVKKDTRIIDCMHQSITLFLRKSTFTIGALIQMIAVSALLMVTVVSVPLLFAGMFSVFMLNIFECLADVNPADQSYRMSHMTS